jgi:hypothetical protein
MSARKKERFTTPRNESSTSVHEKIAKPNGFFSPKIEERRILSSRRNKGRAVSSPSPGIRTYHYTSKSPSEAVFIEVVM